MANSSPFSKEYENLAPLLCDGIHDSPLNGILEGIAQTAANLCESSIALVSLTGCKRQWSKTCSGMPVREKFPDLTLYSHEILQSSGFMEVKDARFRRHRTVSGEPVIRFCAGVPLVVSEQFKLGTLCIFDYCQRDLSLAQREGLKQLAKVLTDLLREHHRSLIDSAEEPVAHNSRAITDLQVSDQFVPNIDRTVEAMTRGVATKRIGVPSRLFHVLNSNENASTHNQSSFALIDKDTSGLRHQEELINLLSRAIEAVDVGVSIADVTQIDHPLVYVNQALCDLTGFAYEELVGHGVQILHQDSELQPEFSRVQEAVLKGEAVQVLTQCMRKDKSHYTGELSLSPVRNENGALTHYIGIRRDVTTRMELEAQSHQARKIEAVGRLSGGIAHDFNNLLSLISGNLELLNIDIMAERQRNFLNEAQIAVKMGARLTHRLLTFARQRQLVPVVFDVNDLVLNTIELLDSTIGETITLSSKLASDLWTIRADPSEIENTVINLTINARDSMPTGGLIKVCTRNVCITEDDFGHDHDITPGDYIQLSVIDNGYGMSEEVKARIFEPFFTTKEPDKGTGMGLASIHGFVHQSGGYIKVSSELGQGTVISLFLPKYLDKNREVKAHQFDEVNTTHSDARVLVVEDNQMVRELTINQLQLLGFSTVQASTGPEAVEYLENNSDIDLVLSDVVMSGGMSGYDVARWVQKHMPDLKFLLTSGDGEQSAEDNAFQASKLQVLHKPYSLVDLQLATSNILGSELAPA